MLSTREIDLLKTIEEIVCFGFVVSPRNLHVPGRNMAFVLPRNVTIYLSTKVFHVASIKSICNYFYNKNHTTGMHAIKMVEKLLRDDVNFNRTYQKVLNRCADSIADEISSYKKDVITHKQFGSVFAIFINDVFAAIVDNGVLMHHKEARLLGKQLYMIEDYFLDNELNLKP